MEIRQAIIPLSKSRPGKPLTTFKGVTIHNTGNTNAGANAAKHAKYWMDNCNVLTSTGKPTPCIHYVVDKSEAVCIIPEDEITYHARTTAGNNATTGIEICDNQGGDILSATNRAAQLAAEILMRHGHTKAVWKEDIFQHHDWSGKDCPQDIRNGVPYGWSTFVNLVNSYMRGTVPQADDRPTFHITHVLQRGEMNSSEVQAIQRNLKTLGYYAGTVDGDFGPLTEKAIVAFQVAYKLTPDGKVGRITTEKLGGKWDGR